MKPFSSKLVKFGFVLVIICSSLTIWNASYLWTVNNQAQKIFSIESYIASDGDSRKPHGTSLTINMRKLIDNVQHRPECLQVAANPDSFFRSQPGNGILNTHEQDIARMKTAYSCGILSHEFLRKPPTDVVYSFEKFYLSEPPLLNIEDSSNENMSVVSLLNGSSHFTVGEYVALTITMKDHRGHPKTKGGDKVRVWFVDGQSHAKMAAQITDFNNGTYEARALFQWAGKLRVQAALAYPREYIRALLHVHRIWKTFRPIAAKYRNSEASECTPCYNTPVVPGFSSSDLCNFTQVNGAPWFCGRPVKRQLKCADYEGTIVTDKVSNYPLTDAEMELFKRSCRTPRKKMIPTNLEITVVPEAKPKVQKILSCNEVAPEDTWTREYGVGYMKWSYWIPLHCNLLKPNYEQCFKDKQIIIFGDSNGRKHYYHFKKMYACEEILKAAKKKWHKPLLCVNKTNNFSLRWSPHTNPFINGDELAPLDSLVPTANVIDEIPSQGKYLIILNHFFHLTPFHTSAIEFMFRFIKDALARLFQRNPDVQVILQRPHIAWNGWPEHFAAGDMLGQEVMDLQKEIFKEIKHRVVYLSLWDMSIAAENDNFHPSTNAQILQLITGFMCGR